jgi:hypothetical protein
LKYPDNLESSAKCAIVWSSHFVVCRTWAGIKERETRTGWKERMGFPKIGWDCRRTRARRLERKVKKYYKRVGMNCKGNKCKKGKRGLNR